MGIDTPMGMMQLWHGHGSGEDTGIGMAWALGGRARAWHGHEGDLGMHVGMHGMETGWMGLWGGDVHDMGMDRYMGMVMRWIKRGH